MIGLWLMIVGMWWFACVTYFVFRFTARHKFNAYAAARLDVLFVVFLLLTFVLFVSSAVMVWG